MRVECDVIETHVSGCDFRSVNEYSRQKRVHCEDVIERRVNDLRTLL